jgi:phage shock protein C
MTVHSAPIARPDNLLGVCHAIGDTFGFNPIFLRLLLLVGVMLVPTVAMASYAAMAFAVLAAKLLTRRRVPRFQREMEHA